MKVKIEDGVPNWSELKKKIERLYNSKLIEVFPEYVEKHKDEWMTAYVKIDDKILKIDCDPDYKGNEKRELAKLVGDSLFSGDWWSRGVSKKEYLFGRETRNPFAGELYYISIKSDDVNKRTSGITLERKFISDDYSILPSRVWFYVRKLDDEIQISRLGIPEIAIVEYDSKNEVWL